MKPTKKWVEARLREWVTRLGLDHWAITLDWDTPSDDGTYAQCWRSNDYDKATVYVCPGWREMERPALEATIVHELLHLAVRDMSRAHDFLLEAVEDNPAAHNIAVAAWKRSEEGCVDRMANALAAAFHTP